MSLQRAHLALHGTYGKSSQIHVNLVHQQPEHVHRVTAFTHPALCWDYLWCSLEVCPWGRGVVGPGEGGGGCGGWLGCGPPSGCCWCYLFSNTTGLNSPTTLSVLPPRAAVPSRPMNNCRPDAVDGEVMSNSGQRPYRDKKASPSSTLLLWLCNVGLRQGRAQSYLIYLTSYTKRAFPGFLHLSEMYNWQGGNLSIKVIIWLINIQ